MGLFRLFSRRFRAAVTRHPDDADEVGHPGDHSPDLWAVRQGVGLPDLAQAETPEHQYACFHPIESHVVVGV